MVRNGWRVSGSALMTLLVFSSVDTSEAGGLMKAMRAAKKVSHSTKTPMMSLQERKKAEGLQVVVRAKSDPVLITVDTAYAFFAPVNMAIREAQRSDKVLRMQCHRFMINPNEAKVFGTPKKDGTITGHFEAGEEVCIRGENGAWYATLYGWIEKSSLGR
jgi:hypothetical protein